MGRIDDRQIEDGNIGPPDLAHFVWDTIEYVSGTLYPYRISGTKISGDRDLYWIQDIYRDENDLPYRVVDSLHNKTNDVLRWRKDEYVFRQAGTMFKTSGTIMGEDGD